MPAAESQSIAVVSLMGLVVPVPAACCCAEAELLGVEVAVAAELPEGFASPIPLPEVAAMPLPTSKVALLMNGLEVD